MKPDLERCKEIFAQALEKKSPADRAAFLAQACPGDLALRHQVESLLRAHEQAGPFLGKAAPSPDSALVAERAGTRIGRYKLLEQIGDGGFGVVYVAEQEEPVRRRVALKVIKPGMDTKQVLARFGAERQALALMDHPSIARVFDGGATEAGRPYFVMELVRGERITDYCDANKLPLRERLALFIQVCQAVQHAHQKGIIHRDLKPSNILVTEVDGAPVPKVIDFGVAKATQAPLTERTLFTGLHQMIGTPAYMSPEQAGLGALDMDTRSDIYALGVLLYELLTGQTPMNQEEYEQAGMDEIFRLIREQDPPMPSTRLRTLSREELTTIAARRQAEPAKLNRLFRGDLDWIVMKALEKDRRRRYETANELASDLQRHLRHEAVLARPPSQVYRLQKLIQRNKLIFAASGAVLAALVLGLGAATWSFLKERQDRERASAAEKVAVAESTKAKKQAARAEEAQRKLTLNVAASDFSMAVRLIDENHRHDALAYLARSLSLNPTNGAVATRLTTLLASQSWWVPIRTFKHSGLVHSAQFSPDGTRIVTASDDHTARVWDASSGQPLTGPLQHENRVGSAEFSLDGKRIVTSSMDKTARVWDARSGQPLTKPLQHGVIVDSAHFSPDGRRIVTVAEDNTARVWDAQSGQPLTGPLPHGGNVSSARFSPDGRRIVTASADKTAKVWDAQSGLLITGPLQHESEVISAQFSPEGKRIVTGSGDGAVRVWDAQNGQLLAGPMPHGGPVVWAQFDPGGRRIVTASWDNTARVWDAQTGQPLTGPLRHGGEVLSAQFSPDGKRIVTASWDDTARVWDAQTGQPLTEPLQHGDHVVAAQFSPDGKRILTASFENTAWEWEALSGQPLNEPLPHSAEVSSARFSPNGSLIVTASWDHTARVWDAQTGQPLTEPLQHGGNVVWAQFSPDGNQIVTASEDYAARVWDAHSGQPKTGLLQHGSNVVSAQFSPDGRLVVTASWDQTAQVWDAHSGQPLNGPLRHDGFVTSAQFSPDGNWIVTAASDSTARIWDARSGQPIGHPLNHPGVVVSAQFSPDGKQILTASSTDYTALVWDARSGQPLTGFMKHGNWILSAQFSPDGRRLVTASTDFTARVWDAQSGQPVSEPMKHDDRVISAQFSPDGKRVVTASWDKTARVWDAQSGLPISEPLKHGAKVVWAQFSPDGRRIITASHDHTARVWDIAPSPASHPDWLGRLAEVISGKVLNEQGLLEPTRLDRAEVINQIRQELYQTPDNDEWVQWGRWFLADPATRTISPFSKIPVPEYIENRIKENTAASLAEAERLAVGNTELSERIALARSTLEQTTRQAKP
jgi:WD40 repeat protein/serine/threonine protein kinase